MKFNSFKNGFPDEEQMVVVRFQRPYLFNTIKYDYEILKGSEIDYEEMAARSAVGWMYVDDLNYVELDCNKMSNNGIVALYYDENGKSKLAGSGHIGAHDFTSSIWEQERRIWITNVSFELDFYKKFQDSDEWPIFKIEAKIPVTRKAGNGAGLSILYIKANNVQVELYNGSYIRAILLQNENGYSMEMKVE